MHEQDNKQQGEVVLVESTEIWNLGNPGWCLVRQNRDSWPVYMRHSKRVIGSISVSKQILRLITCLAAHLPRGDDLEAGLDCAGKRQLMFKQK